MVMAGKASLKSKHFRNDDYLVIIAFCLYSILLTNYTKTELVGAPYN